MVVMKVSVASFVHLPSCTLIERFKHALGEERLKCVANHNEGTGGQVHPHTLDVCWLEPCWIQICFDRKQHIVQRLIQHWGAWVQLEHRSNRYQLFRNRNERLGSCRVTRGANAKEPNKQIRGAPSYEVGYLVGREQDWPQRSKLNCLRGGAFV